MACVINLENEDSEMEEGEIVDDLSDISSEEEFLMRERLELLEMYNNVLERKKSKNPSFTPGIPKEDRFPTSKGDVIIFRKALHDKNYKPQNKPSKKKVVEAYGSSKVKDHKKKSHHRKKLEVKIISESSEESDDEYRNKRRKLEDAVGYKGKRVDKSSLQARLQRMLANKHQHAHKTMNHSEELHTVVPDKSECIKSAITDKIKCITPNSPIEVDSESIETSKPEPLKVHILVDLCSDDEKGQDIFQIDESSQSQISPITVSMNESQDKTCTNESDEDLELLRQHALNSKATKTTIEQNNQEKEKNQESKDSNTQEHEQLETEASKAEPKKATLLEDEDSDTAELRQICLKSALLKKAIEMKKKQKLRKKLSQSSVVQDHDSFDEYRELESRLNSDNNTDRESVDMDIGSDADEKTKDYSHGTNKEDNRSIVPNVATENEAQKTIKEDELEEDEDLLRAKLLTSLSKNLPNLVDPNIIESIEKEEKIKETTPPVSKLKIPETRLVINVGESDSEGEHEATKNLTKMHAKLAEQVDSDFQQKLELLLKSKRSEVETSELPDVVQKNVPKMTEKYVPKTVNHLPRSEQMEYKYLVKRMAELQKIKEARQHAMNSVNQVLGKDRHTDTLKPSNVPVKQMMSFEEIEDQIAWSRKKLAEESSRMLQLREEATKLLQKYKIVSTELKNISTAINLNKKEQRNSQNRLSKIRLEHTRLSSLSKHSKSIGNLKMTNTLPLNKMQKENHPAKENDTHSEVLIPIRVNITNDRLEENVITPARLDTTNNKKTVVTPNAIEKQNLAKSINEILPDKNVVNPVTQSEKRVKPNSNPTSVNKDYESPLQALDSVNWETDPNAIMCPFEVGGNCKDTDCKYFHPKYPPAAQ